MRISQHALAKLEDLNAQHALNLEADDLVEAVRHGQSYPVTRYPDQTRYVHRGLAVILSHFNDTIVTVYLDKVITPLRPDQIARGEQIARKF